MGGVILETPTESDSSSGFSILSFKPTIRLIQNQGVLSCEGFKPTGEEDNDPLAVMKQILSIHPIKQQQNLPFCGGFIGYIGYDYGQYLEQLPQETKQQVKLPEFNMGFYPVAVVIDHRLQRLFICGLANNQALADRLLGLCHLEEVSELKPFRLLNQWQSNMTKEQYRNKFNQVKQHIENGDCYQINLAQCWSANFEGSAYSAYQRLKSNNLAPYSAFINSPQGAIISVSPECFITASDGVCVTRPIKGTRPRHSQPEKDSELANLLRNSEKDRAENVMIVDLLRNDFSKVCKPHTVKVETLCELESYPAVHHLVSTISGVLDDDKGNTDLLAACFPGGSITGAPKIRAMEIIDALEPHNRSVYCGCIGYLSCDGKMDTNIAIRTLVCTQNKIYCWAGGGLVIDSTLDEEYLETQQKVAKILPLLEQTMSQVKS